MKLFLICYSGVMAGPKRLRKRTFLDILKQTTGLELGELETATIDRELWREGYCLFPT